MFFNSINFALFLPIVLFLYWLIPNKKFKSQNLLLLGASYFFYSCWDYRFLLLLVFSTLLDYWSGLKIYNSKDSIASKAWLWLSISLNLGFLGFFKYYNFFADSFAKALQLMGIHPEPWVLNIILPVGISFYTFHGISYVVDIYNKKIQPEKNFITYSLFVSYFPLLVAGPIERATHLLPQFKFAREFNKKRFVDGLRQILWGLFKKIVIADTCAIYTDHIFDQAVVSSGSTHLLGAFFFSFQIYCDFSGYSDIALGVSKLFGIELLRNFHYPYFSRDIAEFWRRWHISLTTWFRDYVYIPLGGSRMGKWINIRNVFIIFLVSGLWHGANLTFLFWGLLNAIYFLPIMLSKKNRTNIGIIAPDNFFPSVRELIAILCTFTLTTLAWVFFRADNVQSALLIFSKIFSLSLFTPVELNSRFIFIWIFILTLTEWLGRKKNYPLEDLESKIPVHFRWVIYYFLFFAVFFYYGTKHQFIYFQF